MPIDSLALEQAIFRLARANPEYVVIGG